MEVSLTTQGIRRKQVSSRQARHQGRGLQFFIRISVKMMNRQMMKIKSFKS
jgi:hypothetical protein